MRRTILRATFAATVAALLVATSVLAAPPGTKTQAAENAACATLFSVPTSIGPDPLGACQWDMRAIGATTAGSYAVNKGKGARVGDIDTGSGDLSPETFDGPDRGDGGEVGVVFRQCQPLISWRDRRSAQQGDMPCPPFGQVRGHDTT